MEKLFKIISPIISWSIVSVASLVAVVAIFVNYKIVVSSFSLEAEAANKLENKNIASEVASNTLIDCSCEKTFKTAYPVIWSGKVIASFAGGEDIGVEKYDRDSKYKKFYVDAQGKYNEALGSDIRVTGRLIGITCAYANTIFKECVGEVVADQITAFK
jgi:hypothetical protein